MVSRVSKRVNSFSTHCFIGATEQNQLTRDVNWSTIMAMNAGLSVFNFCHRNGREQKTSWNNRDLTFASFHGSIIVSPEFATSGYAHPYVFDSSCSFMRKSCDLLARAVSSSSFHITSFSSVWNQTVPVHVVFFLWNASLRVGFEKGFVLWDELHLISAWLTYYRSLV
jgi:hypothetical protein